MYEDLVLTKEELDSALWKKLEAHNKERLNKIRKRNDSPDLDEMETAFTRGEVLVCKQFLLLNPENEDL